MSLPDTPPVRDQVALVTGANAGMGLATARALLQAGYRVAATEDRVIILHVRRAERPLRIEDFAIE